MKKGFTLLELLVVVAIIGLLSVIVMAVISTTQKKANLAYVQQSMDQIRKQTELFIANNGSPGPTNGNTWIRESIIDTFGCTPDCFPEDPTIKKIMKSVYPRLDVFHPSDPQRYFIYSIKGNDWAIAAWNIRNNLNIYCIDSTGRNVSRRYLGTASAPVITNGMCVK